MRIADYTMCIYAQNNHDKCGCKTWEVTKCCWRALAMNGECPLDIGRDNYPVIRRSHRVCGFHVSIPTGKSSTYKKVTDRASLGRGHVRSTAFQVRMGQVISWKTLRTKAIATKGIPGTNRQEEV
jgi:hypothetical protein